jgi:4,5-dihydroxyphthalate decarboxylase
MLDFPETVLGGNVPMEKKNQSSLGRRSFLTTGVAGVASAWALGHTPLLASQQPGTKAAPLPSGEKASDARDKLTLTFACGLYDRMLPLYSGRVSPEGIDLKFLAMDEPREIFDRMGGQMEFDASEFSSSEFITRLSAGNCPFVAIPVFPSRVFRHGHITVNRRSGITKPKDLEGKRVGLPLYTQTAVIFIRGLLQHEYGVDLSKVHWVQGEMNVPGAHGNPTVLPLLKPVPIEIAPANKSLSNLLEERAIDAIIGTGVPIAIRTNPDIQRLFPNYADVERDYYKRTKIFPIMHLVAIRRDIYEEHPFIAASLYNAMGQSKKRALARMHELAAMPYMLPWMTAEVDEIDETFAGGDPYPYGVEANRATLQALVTYMYEQYMIPAPIPIEKLFVKVES